MTELISVKDKNVIAFIKEGMNSDERIVVGINCITSKKHQKAFIATNKRIVLYSRGSFFSGPKSYESIGYDKVSSIEIENKIFTTRGFQLTAYTSGNDISVHCIDGFGLDADGGKKKSHLYREAIVLAIEKFNSTLHKHLSTNQIDPVEQLERLSKLRKTGTLSDDEFQAAKRKILGGWE